MPDVLRRGVGLVVTVLGLFAGAAAAIAPPPVTVSSGFAGLFLLILFLVVAALSKKQTQAVRRHWIALSIWTAAATFLLALGYLYLWRSMVFSFDPATHIKGLWMTPAAAGSSETDPPELVANAGGLGQIYRVWPKEAVDLAFTLLTAIYTIVMLGIFGAVVFIVEGMFGAAPTKRKTSPTDPQAKPDGSGSKS